MTPKEYARIASALGIGTDEVAELEAEWRDWRDFQHDKHFTRVTLRPNFSQR